MLVDSHCHLNFNELMIDLNHFLAEMKKSQVSHALCVATRPDNIAAVVELANNHPQLFAAVGIHPDEELPDFELTAEYLIAAAAHPKVIAIGETGLDYYRNKDSDFGWQHARFATQIAVAKELQLPLIIHTRDSAQDTWQMLHDLGASSCGGVLHCFTESVEWARKFLDLGFYISLSGIVTFKNALQVQEVARFVPAERLLVETDAPYLAPVPQRGKLNHPALVRHTAQYIADLRQLPLSEFARQTSVNFARLFPRAGLSEIYK